ncbi:uncharacterized protein LOC106174068 isoform X1 [Lingula anatina]|uniref:Uncharacterized protein LOC106174068 isoform X1 n=1 Tax=Lingula anatina TaxID=7574 RepID=A0A1S3JLX5_LINAN|nr:uncharacterized protein LOC106174068 isoform X1 [Lingula anatina]|eukprot:XP_013410914.1 uncharacterized protein LOC106174068 isoform X1 [Lingula anatina]
MKNFKSTPLVLVVFLLISGDILEAQGGRKNQERRLQKLMRLQASLGVPLANDAANDAVGSDGDASKVIRQLQSTVAALGRQLIMQQLFVEERIRSEGSSGIKQIRLQTDGTRPYHSTTYTGNSAVSIHNHANYDRTIGMGEFAAVLNGVEFRTRHNDYKFVMPCRRSKDFHCTEDIPFPDVPPEVRNKATVQEQIAEMKEWFKAWKNQDKSHRDYTKYFKANLCYLEGAWMKSSASLEESFDSDRHFLDATDWFDLHEKARFSAYSGRKDNLENFAYLPVTISGLINGTIPELAQWNYRILCHPLKKDIPFSHFRTVDDLHSRMAYKSSMALQTGSRRARFQLNPDNREYWSEEKAYQRSFLDELMEQIPGKDNYPANITDDIFGYTAFTLDPDEDGNDRVLNAGYYHRWFKVAKKGANGLTQMHRSYSDQNIFMAMTSQEKVAGLSIKDCKLRKKNNRVKDCGRVEQKWTYAIPLEIVYSTPLSSWNPYNLHFKGDAKSDLGKTVREGPNGSYRNGKKEANLAFDGTNNAFYYHTPVEMFYTNGDRDAADTVRYRGVGVLDRQGEIKSVDASGFRIELNIDGAGEIRQRWPIMPVSVEGSTIMKEIEALKDMVMEQRKYISLYRELPIALASDNATDYAPTLRDIELETTVATEDPPGPHTHMVRLTADHIKIMKEDGRAVTVMTSTDFGHFHQLRVRYVKRCDCFRISKCDNQRGGCWDGHSVELIPTAG